MGNRRITLGQLSAAAWAAVIAPAVGVLPGVTARQAGIGAWLAPLMALPLALLLGRVLAKVNQCGLAETLVRRFGTKIGKSLIIIYIIWALALGSARLRLSGRRLLYTAQRETGLWFVPVVLVVLAVWLVCRKAEAFVRAAAIFSRILTAALLSMLVLTAVRIRPENLLPLWTGGFLPTLKGIVPSLGVLGYGVYAAFLWDGDGCAEFAGWRIAGGCGVLLWLQMAVLGNLGAELTAALEDPFLTLSKLVGAAGAFRRLESLICALWLLGDLALLALLLWSCRRMFGVLLPGRKDWVAVALATAALAAGALFVFRDAMLAQKFECGPALWGNLILGVGVPLLLGLGAARSKKRAYLVPNPQENGRYRCR